jgi:CDP-6-deoxy-D-xylo-4-hexulose-3-dehydrase
MNNIPLVRDTIDYDEILLLIEWLKSNPRLTKGKLTEELEKSFSEWQGSRFSIFLNSGSSANLAIFYSLLLSERLKNKKIIVPAVSWVTTVSPVIQLGMTPILCDTDKETLGVDTEHLEYLFKKHDPALLIIVHVLGFPNKMKEVVDLCQRYDVILIEDTCESVGSLYNDEKVGNFGLLSSFSTYYGHHFSTIEGGFVSTNDESLYNVIKSIRAHGWDRDLDSKQQKLLREKYDIDEFKSLYTFYYPGFNLRSTDLQAFIGLNQLKKLDDMINKRYENFILYDKLIKNDYWKIKKYSNVFVSNHAYPVIHPNIKNIVKQLKEYNIECRPLICGSISKQPFFMDIYGEVPLGFSEIVHEYGLYIPNNHDITVDEIKMICEIVNYNS